VNPLPKLGQKAKRRLSIIGVAVAATALVAGSCLWVIYWGYVPLSAKGVWCSVLGLVLLGVVLARLAFGYYKSPIFDDEPWPWLQREEPRLTRIRQALLYDSRGKYSLWSSTPFFLMSALFLLVFPNSEFLQSVGLVAGLIFVLMLTLLLRGLMGDSTITSLGAIIVWCVVVWLWGEAGREGFVVLSVDVPAGAEKADKASKLEFTGDGVANALETEIETFGSGEYGNYADTEAAQILVGDIVSRLFPTKPWYKNAAPHAPQLKGLETSHLILNTQIHGLPLSGIYHVLRHLRGKPIIEGQMLIGDNGDLTLALRTSNYQVSCFSSSLSGQIKSRIQEIMQDPMQDPKGKDKDLLI